MTSPISSNYVNSLWGMDTPLAAVNDQNLAALLLPYLGTLQTYKTDVNGNIVSAPFTKEMSLSTANTLHKFLADLQNNANWGNLESDLNGILSIAQTLQKEGLPSWSGYSAQPSESTLFLGSGGLTRNTASVLGNLLASLQQAGILTFAGNAYAVNTASLGTWLNSNLALVEAVQKQVSQDVPVATGTILVNGVETTIQIPLNKSLQEVLQTQYVQHGANIVYSGLQSVVNQQQEAEDAIKILNQLQQVYNGIEAIPASDLLTGFNTTNITSNDFKTALATYLYNAMVKGGGHLYLYLNPTTLGISISTDYASAADLANAMTLSATSNQLLIEIGSVNATKIDIPSMEIQGTEIFISSLSNFVANNIEQGNLIKSPNGDVTRSFLSDFIIQQYGPGTANSIFNTTTTANFLSTLLDPSNPTNYLADLPAVLSSIFPEPGATFSAANIQIYGAMLSTAAGGNMQQLINQIYQSYLGQGAQRLLDAANVNGSNIIMDPTMTIDNATGQIGYIVNPVLTGSAQTTAQNNLQVIRSILAYAYSLNVPGAPGTSTTNLTTTGGTTINYTTTNPVSGSNGTLTGVLPATGAFGFGSPQGGGLEDNLRSILGGLVGGSAIIGGNASVTGAITYEADGSLNITNWILGIWPTGLGDMPANTNIALDQTQTYLSNAFSSASAVNSQLQQELQQAFFLFQEFMQSATDTLSAINQLIVKKAQAISG